MPGHVGRDPALQVSLAAATVARGAGRKDDKLMKHVRQGNMSSSFWRFVFSENFPAEHFYFVDAAIKIEDFHVGVHVLLTDHLEVCLLPFLYSD